MLSFFPCGIENGVEYQYVPGYCSKVRKSSTVTTLQGHLPCIVSHYTQKYGCEFFPLAEKFPLY